MRWPSYAITQCRAERAATLLIGNFTHVELYSPDYTRDTRGRLSFHVFLTSFSVARTCFDHRL